MTTRANTTARLHPIEFDLVRQLERLMHHVPSQQNPAVLLLCVSGGMDSMALLQMFDTVRHHRTASNLEGMELHVLHCNHERRGDESLRDAEFVQTRCSLLAIPCHVEHWSESGPSGDAPANFQNAARKWRYEVAERLLNLLLATRSESCRGWIVTAHHARDHAESMLLHIIRGCGAPGLLGVRAQDDECRRLRPLARVCYSDLMSYVTSRNITYREDASNQSEDYDRNFVRKRLLPLIAEKNPAYEEALLRLSDNVSELMTLAEQQIAARPLSPQEDLTATQILLHARRLAPELGELVTRNVLENILHHCRLIKSATGTGRSAIYRIPLANNWEVLLSAHELVFRHKTDKDTP